MASQPKQGQTRQARKVISFGCTCSWIRSPSCLATLLVSEFSRNLLVADTYQNSFIVARARDAIIQADKNRYNGANRCLLWKAFASRGLGTDAITTVPYKDGSAIPGDC